MTDKVIEIYNKGQDRYEVKDIRYESYIEEPVVRIIGNEINCSIGFYEWVIIPKYKVFEVFLEYLKQFLGGKEK